MCKDNRIDNDIIDMIRNSYDRDTKNIAVRLDLQPHRRDNTSVLDSSLFTIDTYTTKPFSNLKEFKDFINNKDKMFYKDKFLQIKFFLGIP